MAVLASPEGPFFNPERGRATLATLSAAAE